LIIQQILVGGALAMVFMKLPDYQPDDFAANHPGGQLGKRLLLTVGDIISSGEANPVIPFAPKSHFFKFSN